MKPTQCINHLWISSIMGSAAILLAAQSASAIAHVTSVNLDSTNTGVDLVLHTEGSDRPQLIAVRRGKALTADIANTQLKLPEKTFKQVNPVDGIAFITVAPLSKNSVRVTVMGTEGAPSGKIMRSANDTLAFQLSPSNRPIANEPDSSVLQPSKAKSLAPDSTPKASAPQEQSPTQKTDNSDDGSSALPKDLSALPQVIAQAVQPQPNPGQTPTGQANPGSVVVPSPTNNNAPPPVERPVSTPAPAAQITPPPPGNQPLVPNPRIEVQGRPYTPAPPIPPHAPLPLPRAVAPPVGDMAVGQIDASPTVIDLGTAERVPRLVLRDASSREVLSLLARTAGLNIVFTADQQQDAQQAAQAGTQQAVADGPRITLDIVNEPVQNVFNYVLQVTGLQANRVGNTIFVGPRLPLSAQNVVTRTLRLNQAAAATAAAYLSTQGASTQRAVEVVRVEEVGTGVNRRFVETRTTEIRPLEALVSGGPLILKGLALAVDDRLNSVTLVGPPRLVEIASSLLTQIDARRRQIAVNVRIIDVNLLNTELINSSFSFGVGDSFFSVDDGAALVNFGRTRPPSNSETATSLTSPPVTRNIFPTTSPGFVDTTLGPFVDAPQSSAPFGTNPINEFNGGRPPFGTNNNPYAPGATQITPGSSTPLFGPNGNLIGVQTTPTQVTYGLPSLFQFPKKFLAQLQAQVVSGTAKILTDPTLAIQEGETSTIQLTQQVVSRVSSTFTDTAGGTREVVQPELADAGLILGIQVSRIDDNGFISMRITPEVSAPVQTVQVGGENTTLLARRRVESGTIRIRDGQTLILAGIIQDTDRATVRKIPILGDIPILGALFRSTQNENQRQEVIVLITPRILDDSDQSAFGYSYTPGLETQRMLNNIRR